MIIAKDSAYTDGYQAYKDAKAEDDSVRKASGEAMSPILNRISEIEKLNRCIKTPSIKEWTKIREKLLIRKLRKLTET